MTNTQINVSKLAIDEREELKKHGNVVKILLAHNADVKSTFDFKIGLEKRKVRAPSQPGNCETVTSL